MKSVKVCKTFGQSKIFTYLCTYKTKARDVLSEG